MRNGAKAGIVLAILVLTALALYYYMVNKAKGGAPEVETTAVQDVLLKNLEKEYPTTVREVMKYYNELIMCYYNEEHEEDEFEMLAQKAMELYDSELVDYQDDVKYMLDLEAEVAHYRDSKTVISSYALASSTDVDYYSRAGRDCANIRCIYTLRQGVRLETIKELYVLRKDSEGHWKILGWSIVDERGEAEIKAGKGEQAEQ